MDEEFNRYDVQREGLTLNQVKDIFGTTGVAYLTISPHVYNVFGPNSDKVYFITMKEGICRCPIS